MKTNNTHPLLNPDSPHYQMVDGVEAIERMEQMFSLKELMAWSLISSFKYRLRIGAKDDPSKEIAKIKSFEAYYTYLENILKGESEEHNEQDFDPQSEEEAQPDIMVSFGVFDLSRKM